MARDGITVRVYGLREVRRALRQLPDEAKDAMRDAAFEIGDKLAQRIRAAAAADNRQTALLAPTVRAVRKGFLPTVTAGGDTLVGRNRKPAYKILFGSEFGSTFYKQFRPHRGANSYWFFKTQEEAKPEVDRQWRECADDIISRWSA